MEIGGENNNKYKGGLGGKLIYIGEGPGEEGSVLDLIIEIENETGNIVREVMKENMRREWKKRIRKGADQDGQKTREYEKKIEKKRIDNSRRKGTAKRWDSFIKSIWEVGKSLKMMKIRKEGEGKERNEDIKARKKYRKH